jgi:dihydroflavonol-4-reductase
MSSEKRVLVTGISGFLGCHVAVALLERGYSVRGSIRDPARASQVRESFRAAGADITRLELCVLDLLDDRGWAEAAEGCRYLHHVASPFVLTMPKDKDALIRPAVEGTRRAIRAGLKAGHERIVLTSSVVAIDGGHLSYDRPFSTDDWTRVDDPRVNAYGKSKTLAEQQAWELVQSEGAQEKLAVINPGTILGPLLDDDPGTSVAIIQRLLKGEMPMIPNLILPYVDVRDVADAHVAAMTAPDAGGKRHIVANAGVPLPDVARMLRERFPERAKRIPARRMPAWMARAVAPFNQSLRDSRAWLDVSRSYDVSSGRQLLGRPLRPTREAVMASARSLLERGLA